jgi:hypothetical protein
VNDWVNFSALWQIVVVGLLCGAGLPAVFAVGLWLLEHGPGVAAGPEPRSAADRAPRPGSAVTASPLGVAGAGACFALVLAAIGWGIYFIVAGS